MNKCGNKTLKRFEEKKRRKKDRGYLSTLPFYISNISNLAKWNSSICEKPSEQVVLQLMICCIVVDILDCHNEYLL